MQLPLYEVQSSWRPPRIEDLPSWDNAPRVAIDCETCDLHLRELGPGCRRGGYTVGWSVALESGPSFYLPTRHEGGDNLDVDQVHAYMRDNARVFKGEVVGANLSYDLDYAANDEIEFNSEVTFRDIQVADPLIYELHKSYSLAAIGERWGVKGKEEELLVAAARNFGVDPKGGMWRLPARYVGEYAENDTKSPLEIFAKQWEEIQKKKLEKVFALESQVLPVLIKMRRRGVRIDQDRLAQIKAQALQEEKQFLDEIHRLTGVRIEVGQVWKKVGPIAQMFEAIGVTLQKTPQGAPKIDAQVMGNTDHPAAKLLRQARQTNKLRTTFCESIERYMVDGRIHCTIHQIARENDRGEQRGVRYGRLSAEDPNLQQQISPDRSNTELAKSFRQIYLPEENSLWGCNDYSQQEVRWATHYAAVMDFPKAREVVKKYQENPSLDNHAMMTAIIHGEELIKTWEPAVYKQYRAYAKDIFLGLSYGEGGAKLCKGLGLPTRFALIEWQHGQRLVQYFPTRHKAMRAKMDQHSAGNLREVAGEEGQRILDLFNEKVPYVRRIQQAASNRAQAKGFVTTFYGRRLHFTRKDDGRIDWSHKSLNRIIQGTSADQAKQALIDMDREGYFIQLPVHDEVDGSYESPEQAKEAGAIMRDAVLVDIPFKVDTEVGPNWGDLKSV